jgi:oligopeptide/dipeptide ABC transporter ATP-binding protein
MNMMVATPDLPLLAVDNLSVEFRSGHRWEPAVRDVSFSVAPGETLCIVGESGSGKSVSTLSVMGLLPERTARRSSGTIQFDGRALENLTDAEMTAIRGRDIGMIFQEPMTSLNPAMRIGTQLAEVVRRHAGASRSEGRRQALEMLQRVRIPDAVNRLDAYPHELSGGMRQRVMIAMALMSRPKLLIADEPTTALDVTIQAQVLALMAELKREFGTSLILITHNLGVVAEMADRVAVFRSGQKVEEAPVADIFERPQHPYTRALLAATPRIGEGSWRDGRVLQTIDGTSVPLATSLAPNPRMALRATDLVKRFAQASGWLGRAGKPIRAVDGISLELQRGQTLAIVGESGCGKSTLARMLMLTINPTDGEIEIDGQSIATLSGEARRQVRRRIQMVFQDPFASLHPQMTARQIVAEPLINLSEDDSRTIDAKVTRLFDLVGLKSSMLDRHPFEFSGGQRQRIAIARAIVLNPTVVVADEPVSALDVSVQAQILNLMASIQGELGLSYIFISHDLSVVEYIADTVAVMYLGRIVERAPRAELYRTPLHPYTAMLFQSVPSLDPGQRRFSHRVAVNELPSPSNIPTGCRFRTRCRFATELCATSDPALTARNGDHYVACHYPGIALKDGQARLGELA